MRVLCLSLTAVLLMGACDGGGAQAECDSALGDFMGSLKEIDSRLDIGMTYADYGSRVSDAKVTYDAIEFDELSQDCIDKVGVPAERALNAYVEAYQMWNLCIEGSGCDDKDTVAFQQQWTEASGLLDDAESGLDP